MKNIKIDLKPIGIVHSPYKTRMEAPNQGKDDICKIEIYKEFEGGLKDIEGFSHLHLIYWLHKSHNYGLDVLTPWDTVSHGLFTTRTPRRVNPVGYSVVELIRRKENILLIKGLDAIDGTPVIDIKPYIPRLDVKNKVKTGWASKTKLNG